MCQFMLPINFIFMPNLWKVVCDSESWWQTLWMSGSRLVHICQSVVSAVADSGRSEGTEGTINKKRSPAVCSGAPWRPPHRISATGRAPKRALYHVLSAPKRTLGCVFSNMEGSGSGHCSPCNPPCNLIESLNPMTHKYSEERMPHYS